MNVLMLVKLLFAHILSDFILQTDRMNRGKRVKERKRYSYLFLHGMIYSVTAYLIIAQWTNWVIPLVIFVSHIMIDFIKGQFKDDIRTFIYDQIAHMSVIVALWALTDVNAGCLWTAIMSAMNNIKFICCLTAYLLVLKPTSIFLQLFIKRWTPDTKTEIGKSLPNAGQWIGYIERILILTFVLADSVEGVGFLLAAKLILCFGELHDAQDIKVMEYVLIGTLFSFAVAILVGYGVKLVW